MENPSWLELPDIGESVPRGVPALGLVAAPRPGREPLGYASVREAVWCSWPEVASSGPSRGVVTSPGTCLPVVPQRPHPSHCLSWGKNQSASAHRPLPGHLCEGGKFPRSLAGLSEGQPLSAAWSEFPDGGIRLETSFWAPGLDGGLRAWAPAREARAASLVRKKQGCPRRELLFPCELGACVAFLKAGRGESSKNPPVYQPEGAPGVHGENPEGPRTWVQRKTTSSFS